MKNFFKILECYSIWIVLCVCILFYILSNCDFELYKNYPNLLKLIERLGDVFGISVISSFLLKTLRYSNFFQNALLEVIYKKEYLENREDLESIWKNVSKALFSRKFEEIHEPFLEVIHNQYFPNDTISYYSNIVQVITIRWKDDSSATNTIQINEKIDLTVHTINEDKFSYDGKYTLVNNGEPVDNLFKLEKYLVNEQPQDVEKIKTTENIDDNYIVTCKVELQGSTNYNISQISTRWQNLSIDNYHGYTARYLIKNMDIQIDFPEDLEVNFFKAGTVGNFKKVYETEKSLRYRYDGIILKKQGYIITFHKK